jgi:hypothetical protein
MSDEADAGVLWEGNVSKHYPHRLMSNGAIHWRNVDHGWVRENEGAYAVQIAMHIARLLAEAKRERDEARENADKWALERKYANERLARVTEAAKETVKSVDEASREFVTGWDEDGALDPAEPLSWESVGRCVLDIARARADDLRAALKEPANG